MSSTNLPDKWIVGLDPAGAVIAQAPRVLQKRLEAVAERVRDVIKSSGRDDEAVHQLRVSMRRAQATMVSFKPWLKKSRRRRVKKSLRRLQERAGVVRMCDVHRGLLRSTLAATPEYAHDRAVVEFALAILARERETSLATLVRTAKRVPINRLTASAARLIRTNDQDGDYDGTQNGAMQSTEGIPTEAGERQASQHARMRSAGHAALGQLAQELREAGAADLSCRENLHQLRLSGKRLRYALEIFGATEEDSASLAGLADHLASQQERLGEVNDHHEVAERLQGYADEAAGAVIDGSDTSSGQCMLAAGVRALAERFEARCAALAAEFLRWWRSGEADEFHRLVDMLAGREIDLAHDEPIPEVVVLAGNNGLHGEASQTGTVGAGEGHAQISNEGHVER